MDANSTLVRSSYSVAKTLLLALCCIACFSQQTDAQGCPDIQLTPAGNAPMTANFGSLFEGDLNSDGFADLVLTVPFPQPQPVQVIYGDGLGGLSAPILVQPGHNAINIATGDFNGDSHVDLLIGTDGTNVVLATGSAAGTFSIASTIDVSSARSHVSAGDLTGDGNLDFVVTRQVFAGPSSVRLYAGDGMGGFAAPVDIVSGPMPQQVEIADYDNNGVLDLAVGNSASASGVAVLNIHYGNGTGGVGAATMVSAAYGQDFASGDVNGDGVLDFCMIEYVPVTLCGVAVSTSISQPGGTYATGPSFTGLCGPFFPRFADFNNDGHTDLIYTDGGDFVHSANFVQIHTGDSTGTFATPCMPLQGSWSPHRYGVADMNGDLRPDYIAVDFSPIGVVVHLNSNAAFSDFVRGDCNDDATMNLADAVFLLTYLFPVSTQPTLNCEAACDANDDEGLNLADAVSILNALFGNPAPMLPAPTVCGADPTGGPLGCASFVGCP